MYSRVQTSGIGAQWPPASVAPQCEPAGKSQNVPVGQAAAPRVPQSAPLGAALPGSLSSFVVDAAGAGLVVSGGGLSDPEDEELLAEPEQAVSRSSAAVSTFVRMRAFSHAHAIAASALASRRLSATARSRAA